MNEKQVEATTEYALELASEVADRLFNEHLERFDFFEESDRKKWVHGFCSGFSSGFVTAVIRADAVVKDAERKIPVLKPGVN